MRQNDKRTRLTHAAKQLFYRQGVAATSLADIAQAAGVPLGNIYYHFKTKEALIEGVIAAHGKDILDSLAGLSAERQPKARLLAYVRSSLPFKDQLAQYGCPYGTLCNELEKTGQNTASSASTLFKLYLDWLERQFAELGHQAAPDLALETLCAVQGAYTLSHAAHSAAPLERQIARLEHWIKALEPEQAA